MKFKTYVSYNVTRCLVIFFSVFPKKMCSILVKIQTFGVSFPVPSQEYSFLEQLTTRNPANACFARLSTSRTCLIFTQFNTKTCIFLYVTE